jgi:WD40 repeat protein
VRVPELRLLVGFVFLLVSTTGANALEECGQILGVQAFLPAGFQSPFGGSDFSSQRIIQYSKAFETLIEKGVSAGLIAPEDLREMLRTNSPFQLTTAGPSERTAFARGLSEIERATSHEGFPSAALRSSLITILEQWSEKLHMQGIKRTRERTKQAGVFSLYRTLPHPNEIVHADFSADGAALITVDADQKIRIWNLERLDFKDMSGPALRSGYVSFRGNKAALALFDPSIFEPLVSKLGGRVTPYIGSAAGAVDGLLFSLNGAHLLERSDIFGGIRIYDARTGAARGLIQDIGEQTVWAMAFSPLTDALFASLASGRILELEPSTWKLKREVAKRDFNGYSLAVSPDGEILVQGGSGKVNVTHVNGGAADYSLVFPSPLIHAETARSLAFTPDGRLLAVGLDHGRAVIWDIPNKRVLSILIPKEPLPWRSSVHSISFSPDAKTLVTASPSDSVVRLWNLEELGILSE